MKITRFLFAAFFVFAFAGGVCASNALLQPARKAPEWLTRGVMYQIQPRAFTPEGTLRAAAEKLPYLKETGVTIVYLPPVFEMDTDGDRSFWSPRQLKSGFGNPKNQYRIRDYFHVDPEYGTDADLRHFVDRAHELGLKVLFDLVYFHCGPTARVIKDFPDAVLRNGDGSPKRGFWRFPQFDFSKPVAREYLLSNFTYLLVEFGVDGFRCDVADALPVDFWCEARRRMDALKDGDAVLLCEGFDPQDQLTAFDANYGWFPRAAFDDKEKSAAPAKAIREGWTKREHEAGRGARFVNHYENHDWATNQDPRPEARWGREAIEQVLVWMFTLDGVPLLFNGNEIADDDGAHSMFGKTPIDWSRLESPEGRARRAFVKKLAEFRASRPSLTDLNGEKGLVWLKPSAEDAVTAFRRVGANGERTLVVQNWTSGDVSFKVPGAVFSQEPLLSRRYSANGADVTLGPWGYAVLPEKESGDPAMLAPKPFADGERVVFFGDSITRQGFYEGYLQLHTDLTRPGSGVKILNAGVSGDTAEGGLVRFDWDLKPFKPDRVFMMFGMNDVDVKLYEGEKPSPALAAKRKAQIEQYEKNLRALAKRITDEGWELVLMTPTPYDEYSPGNKAHNYRDANEVGLSACADVVRRVGESMRCPVIDLYVPLTEKWKKAGGTGPTVDRVHPSEAGYRLVAAEILAALGCSGVNFPTNGPAYDAMRAEIDRTAPPRMIPQVRMAVTKRGGDPENRESFEKTIVAWRKELEATEEKRRYIDYFTGVWNYYRKAVFKVEGESK
jgi:glycosidase/lysophospholipase L1-like esterase